MDNPKHVFFVGALFYMSVISLYQDFLGKEGYIDLIKSNWVPSYISVPIALILLVYSMYVYIKIMRNK
jgi:hypothetical protein